VRWTTAAQSAACDKTATAWELAVEFASVLYGQRVLVGMGVSSWWVRKQYPHLCRALGVARPPPFKDFAKELDRLLPRKRMDWRAGAGRPRTTQRFYYLRAPTRAVALAVAATKRSGVGNRGGQRRAAGAAV
jgi:hypothetical protein